MKTILTFSIGTLSGTAVLLLYLVYPELFSQLLLIASIPLCGWLMKIMRDIYPKEWNALRMLCKAFRDRVLQMAHKRTKVIYMAK